MNIAEILKVNQPNDYKKIKSIANKKKRKRKNKRNESLTESEIISLMYHSSYKRSTRGAIKQVR
ncbi:MULTISPECIES: hypothetical protein [Clostridium]|uniref:hypothetical protein n=1 Tax=Clostridium TaxID=1485 RepID=UPI00115BD815|nr:MULTISPECIES: hypothetical protein [Clostridium]MDY4605401.1 hypothetical protein [Clostridium tertium]